MVEKERTFGVQLRGAIGHSADRRVLLGFASAKDLASTSFADVLNEDTGTGYQRRFSDAHSLDFRKYIHRSGSTTIPLTFNARASCPGCWTIDIEGSTATLTVYGRALAQVDCQHRLGHLYDSSIVLPFMIYLGLTEREEMEVFNIINSKARGLSSSLLDYHEAKLATDLASERPELLISLHLNNSSDSPWYRQLDLGGGRVSGLQRRASLRTMQKAVRRFLGNTKVLNDHPAEAIAQTVLEFWHAVAVLLRDQWVNPRKHFLTKGIGVYALMGVLADLQAECATSAAEGPNLPTRREYLTALGDFLPTFDWSSGGPLRGLGGEAGAQQALELIRKHRVATRSKHG